MARLFELSMQVAGYVTASLGAASLLGWLLSGGNPNFVWAFLCSGVAYCAAGMADNPYLVVENPEASDDSTE